MHYDHWLESLLSSRLSVEGVHGIRREGPEWRMGQRLTPQRGRDGEKRVCRCRLYAQRIC